MLGMLQIISIILYQSYYIPYISMPRLYHIISIILYATITMPQRSMSTARSGTPCVAGHVSIHGAGDLRLMTGRGKIFWHIIRWKRRKIRKTIVICYMMYDIYIYIYTYIHTYIYTYVYIYICI